MTNYYIFYSSLLCNWPEVRHWILGHSKVYVILYLSFSFSNKILIEKEDSKKQHPLHYANNHTGINTNWNQWLATIFSTQVFYAISQKYNSVVDVYSYQNFFKVHWVSSWLDKSIIASVEIISNHYIQEYRNYLAYVYKFQEIVNWTD